MAHAVLQILCPVQDLASEIVALNREIAALAPTFVGLVASLHSDFIIFQQTGPMAQRTGFRALDLVLGTVVRNKVIVALVPTSAPRVAKYPMGAVPEGLDSIVRGDHEICTYFFTTGGINTVEEFRMLYMWQESFYLS
ncbi:hypothetical protein VTL71DRAFT_9450 [Oculimacula yallundae]|uniref:Uncharacterized protein n=1 Tax=Oculimacula yallundae TaxID=86028 RepID=A0ABR4BS39_9HELO